MDLPIQVTGYLDDESQQVMLTCEVHGVLRSRDPPTWLGKDGSLIDSNTSKYIIENSNSSRITVLLFNSSTSRVPGWRSTLTINQLGMADEGSYTCVADRNSTTLLTVVAGSAPATSELSNHYTVDLIQRSLVILYVQSICFCVSHAYIVVGTSLCSA